MRKKTLGPLVSFIVVLSLHAIYFIGEGSRLSQKWVQVEEINSLSLYFERQDYLLGISYALAGAFTIFALLKFLEGHKGGVRGVVGGVTLTGVLYFGGCFLLGCCGSPMLAVYLSLFGSSILGFTKPLILILTTMSVLIGYIWIEKKTKTSNRCCTEDEKCT